LDSHTTALTLTDTLTAPKIIVLIKQHGHDQVRLAIVRAVGTMLEYFNATNAMTGKQLVAFADDFIREFKTDSVEDLLYCLREARTGKYGKDFNRIDGVTLFTWYREYLETKLALKEELNHNEKHDQYTIHEDVLTSMKSAIEKPKPKETKNRGSFEEELKWMKSAIETNYYTKEQLKKKLVLWENNVRRYDEFFATGENPFTEMVNTIKEAIKCLN